MILLLLSAGAAAASLDMRWQDLRWGDIRIGVLELHGDSSADGWQLRLGEVSGMGVEVEQLELICRQGQWRLSQPECGAGDWRVIAGGGSLAGTFQWLDAGRLVRLSAPNAKAEWLAGQGLSVDFEQWPLAGIEQLWAEQTTWPQVSSGILDGSIRINLEDQSLPMADVDLNIAELGFDNTTGDLAGVDVSLALTGSMSQQQLMDTLTGHRNAWPFDWRLAWQGGEMLFGPHYLPAPQDSVVLSLDGYYAGQEDGDEASDLLSLQIRADDPEALTLNAQAVWQAPRENWRQPLLLKIDDLQADIPGLQRRYLSGALARVSLDALQTSGSLRLSGGIDDLSGGGPQAFTLSLDDVELVDVQNRFAVSGLNGDIVWHSKWRADDGALPDWDSSLGWETLQIYRLPFESADWRFAAGGDHFTIQPGTRLGFLDAGLVLHQLEVEDLRSDSPAVQMDAELLPVALRDLTAILDWPSFGGQLAGRIPGIELNNGVWTLDGQLELDLFGGQVVLSDLSAERPFGVLPTFNASLWIERLQLEPLTAAFEIGRMTGPVDGRVNDLRLLDWQPVQFDAWLRTSEDPKEKLRISQRAVDTISSIGGGVGGGLQSTFLRLFEDFGYRQLGFSCLLRKGVCELDGIAEAPDGQGFLLVEGSGLPSLNVVGHNRRVAWRRMLNQLKAATKSEGPSIN